MIKNNIQNPESNIWYWIAIKGKDFWNRWTKQFLSDEEIKKYRLDNLQSLSLKEEEEVINNYNTWIKNNYSETNDDTPTDLENTTVLKDIYLKSLPTAYETIIFSNILFEENNSLDFSGFVFASNIKFKNVDFLYKLSFKNAVFTKEISLTDCILRKIPDFNNCQFNSNINIRGNNWKTSNKDVITSDDISSIRTLRKIYIENKNNELNNFYRKRELMAKLNYQKTSFSERMVILIYGFLSGYGNSIFRPLLFIFITFLISFGSYYSIFSKTENKDITEKASGWINKVTKTEIISTESYKEKRLKSAIYMSFNNLMPFMFDDEKEISVGESLLNTNNVIGNYLFFLLLRVLFIIIYLLLIYLLLSSIANRVRVIR